MLNCGYLICQAEFWADVYKMKHNPEQTKQKISSSVCGFENCAHCKIILTTLKLLKGKHKGKTAF